MLDYHKFKNWISRARRTIIYTLSFSDNQTSFNLEPNINDYTRHILLQFPVVFIIYLFIPAMIK